MSFMPDTAPDNRMSSTIRTGLFWLLMILLAVVLWKMASKRPNAANVRTLTYSDFMQQVDKNNVSAAKYFLAQNTAEIQGELRDQAEQFRVTVPKEAIPSLTDQLRKQGARIEVSQSTSGDWTSFIINFAPLIMLVAAWIFMMKRSQMKRGEKS
jgi:cell division protease FtsH